MRICDDGHEPIAYDGIKVYNCPLCYALEELEAKDIIINVLKKKEGT